MYDLEQPTDDERTMATLAHLSAFVAPVVGAVIILLVYNEKSRFVRYHAIQALITSAILGGLGTFISLVGMITCVGSLLLIPFVMIAPLAPCYEAWLAWQGKMKGLPGLEAIGR